MKVESKLFMFMTIFFAVVTGIYVIASMMSYGHVEPIGTTVFVLTLAMVGMIWGYLAVTGRHIDPRPEDTKQGEIPQGAGALGFFPPSSIWPFWCALTASVLLLGVVFGWWVTLLGALMGVWAVCGWCYEFYVGDYRH
ncbi:cytochrome c oxidase subunit 4 [Nigerium massiliense]|uniref:cytochrome c oxidase subunit 4 n=1 Tax=Nigerium massiliense TaxID=1522317 RepID=UPI00058CB30D|nr:cytochrome c oxidase subunit 4 [Nigerium massiliense]